MKFDLKELQKIVDLVQKAEISELSLEDKDGEKISIKKNLTLSPEKTIATVSSNLMTSPVLSSENSKEKSEKETIKQENVFAIKSPMVGTLYLTPSPDAENFVKVGQKINKGDTVCIVEAMKLFNEIEAEISGTVLEVLAENGSAVEYGQELILVKKN